MWYARGLASADMMIEAMKLANDPTKGESVKKGAESIKDFTAHGLSKGTTITPEDHGGSRFVRMYQVKDGDLVGSRTGSKDRRPSLKAAAKEQRAISRWADCKFSRAG